MKFEDWAHSCKRVSLSMHLHVHVRSYTGSTISTC